MANKEHLALLLKCSEKEDFTEWDQWRQNVEGLPDDEIIDFSGEKLRTVDFSGANLEGCYLIGASLIKANLTQADLCEADLTQADLRHANLRHANLTQANIGEVEITEARNLKFTIGLPKLNESNQINLEFDKQKAEKELKRLEAKVKQLELENNSKSDNEAHRDEIAFLKKHRDQLKQTVKKQNDLIQKRDSTAVSITEALEQIQAPNAYIKHEVNIQNILFYTYIAIVVLVSGFLFWKIFWELDFEEIRKIEDSWPCLIVFASQRIIALSLWGVFLTQINRCRTRIQELNERRRGVKSLLGVLLAMNELSSSNEKARERIDAVMDELKDKALSFFSSNDADKSDEPENADRVDLSEDCRKILSELTKAIKAAKP
jgi:Pentapeptide repeats (8 copies)